MHDHDHQHHDDHGHDHSHDHDHDGDHGHEHDHGDHGISRRSVLMAAASLGAGGSLPSTGWAMGSGAASEMMRAASAWLALLDDRQRRAAQLAWDDPRRHDWHYVPRRRPGVTFGQMNDAQRSAAWDLLGTLLSGRGLELVRNQFVVEGILGELTRAPDFRDPGNYAPVVFGDPAGERPWAWRFEGHHLSLTAVVAPGHGIAVTPNFIGANPARVPDNDGHHHGFRLLGAEEDAAFDLIGSIEGALRDQVLIGDRSLGDIVAGPGREDILRSYEGAPLSRLNEAQRDGVMRILQLFTSTLSDDIARVALLRILDPGLDALHFAWAGSLARGRPHYFRIHGPGALIEYDNTQNGANHIHTVWIDPQGLFGRDLLKAHYGASHQRG